MDVMKPIVSPEIPQGTNWMYEVKYDGFRCRLYWDIDGEVELESRRKKELTALFPEITDACRELQAKVKQELPLVLDGELTILNNDIQANFSLLQTRGRMKNKASITAAASSRPATFMAFDLLTHKGEKQTNKSYEMRKKELKRLFEFLPVTDRLQYVTAYENGRLLKSLIFQNKGEGMIAKRKESNYVQGKSHRDWLKIKNWRSIEAFLISYNEENGYFTAAVYDGDEIKTIGKCKHGFTSTEEEIVKQLFLTDGEKSGNLYLLPPAVCVKIHTLGAADGELREPEFASVLPNTSPAECTAQKMQLDLAMLPSDVAISNPDKLYFPNIAATKADFLIYMREAAPYMLPFLNNRAVTLIRCPDGAGGEHFFQKHLPDYAPDFFPARDDQFIVADNLTRLIWLANHGAIEYHLPFQLLDSNMPLEIVFDLDPPDREHFHLAVLAAKQIKTLLDQLQLIAFIKTSGNKGLQIHIPIPPASLTYDDTAIFTEAIANAVASIQPDLFTTERMKKKRHGRLYIDYVQHGENKTIIAPYSPRVTAEATVSMPLFWEEVNEDLHPTQFTINNALDRIEMKGCPFRHYFKAAGKQNLKPLRKLIE